jgi:hypothetical protein
MRTSKPSVLMETLENRRLLFSLAGDYGGYIALTTSQELGGMQMNLVEDHRGYVYGTAEATFAAKDNDEIEILPYTVVGKVKGESLKMVATQSGDGKHAPKLTVNALIDPGVPISITGSGFTGIKYGDTFSVQLGATAISYPN